MLIHPEKSCLLVIDIQDKLLPAIHEKEKLVANSKWLIEVAAIIKIPTITSEQYPQGLGHTVEELRAVLPENRYMHKTAFSCAADPDCNNIINSLDRTQVVIVGMEAHVCVLQTALQLKLQGLDVFVVADAVSSRSLEDKTYALERMRSCGIHIITREMAAFEWMQKSGTDNFKRISKEYLR